ncbi:hypothetical protein [Laspinema olomoucense]|uniref:CRISPR type III-B/RAMP module-associated protein Cmr5 n=1 Tax=Laspinema olomoucense D3b TaxID=2953688 RepID=A0ABT2N9I6_9CYAN|nr:MULTISPECIES: hypothetical protein [unclassified Laspinema]MCT7979353.1 hypothetical protein [Laspinema sp. D3b]MCT7989152.1 hypothetical protein [Laspinema sp. D3a]MCT7993374.1 hypothetical protein [Laspinema sp. D3c]
MTQTHDQPGLYLYDIDHHAQDLVIQNRNKKNVLNESHKMRMAVAYGLERFWGEHLRLQGENTEENKNKGKYWKAVWDALEEILQPTEINLPNQNIKSQKANKEESQKIQEMAKAIWELPLEHQRIALMVLTQLCDSLVWWTQRYKKKGDD